MSDEWMRVCDERTDDGDISNQQGCCVLTRGTAV
jgi:hypothetical protein